MYKLKWIKEKAADNKQSRSCHCFNAITIVNFMSQLWSL